LSGKAVRNRIDGVSLERLFFEFKFHFRYPTAYFFV
jgi:hypothetical protein